MKIQILGTGCPKCTQLAAAAQTAATELGQPFTLTKVTDITQIMAFGVMMTPALVVNGTVKLVGRVPSVPELKTMFANQTPNPQETP